MVKNHLKKLIKNPPRNYLQKTNPKNASIFEEKNRVKNERKNDKKI